MYFGYGFITVQENKKIDIFNAKVRNNYAISALVTVPRVLPHLTFMSPGTTTDANSYSHSQELTKARYGQYYRHSQMFPYNMARNFQPTPTTFIHEQYKVCYR
jgi:hypothetical protein